MRKYLGLVVATLVFGTGAVLRSTTVESWQVSAARQHAMAARPSHFMMKEVTSELGIHFHYQRPTLSEALQPEDLHLVAGGIAVADVNLDGWQDFYVTTAALNQPNHLYLNQQGRGFQEAAALWRVADLNVTSITQSPNPIIPPTERSFASVFPLFFDYDQDSKPDLLVLGLGCSRLFRNSGDSFDDVSEESGIADCRNAHAAVPLDYNKDGFVDVYVLRYFGPQDLFTTDDANVWINSAVNATNGGRNTLYRNNGDGTFTDVTAQMGGADGRWSFDAAAGDFFGDGSMSILVSNDFGPDTLYAVTPQGLRDISSQLGRPDRRLGMGVSAGYLDESGRPYIHVSNAYHPQYRHEGNFLWQFAAHGQAIDSAMRWGSNFCLWAWGSVFADFDINGELDLYIANGFLSGAERKEVAPGIFIDADTQTQDASFRMGTLQTFPGTILESGSVFSSMFRDEAAEGRLSFAGYQQDCLFLNQHQRFADVAAVSGLVDDADGRAVASIDFDNDGAMDLLLTTRNRGLKLFRNETRPAGNWIGFSLVDAAGSDRTPGIKLEVTQGDRVWHRYATGGKTGFLAQSDPRLHVGLLNSAPVDVEVHWPSGDIVKVEQLYPGRYYALCEGQPALLCPGEH